MACAVALPSSAYTIYDGTISSTHLTTFKGILSNIPLDDNYVLFRSSQYEYTLVSGDLTISGSAISSSGNCMAYTLNTQTNNNRNYYTYTTEEISNFNLNVGDRVVYSDIGGYPQLEERGSVYEATITIVLVVSCLFGFLSGISAFIFRRRY